MRRERRRVDKKKSTPYLCLPYETSRATKGNVKKGGENERLGAFDADEKRLLG